MHISGITHPERLVNLLGAVAVAACDLIGDASEDVELQSDNDVAALNFIGHAPGISIDFLAQTLHLSHPGTVRLVDRLAESGLVERGPGKDRRTIALSLTASGQRRRKRLQRGRLGNLETLLAPLTQDERDVLERLTTKMLDAHVREMQEAATVCRLCDEKACKPCPMEKFA